MIALHILLSMFVPCHYKCALMHTLQAMMICDVILLLLSLFLVKTSTTSEALILPICCLICIAAGILRAFFNQLTFSYRFNDREQRKKFRRKRLLEQKKLMKEKRLATLSASAELGKAVEGQKTGKTPRATDDISAAKAVGAVATAEGMQVGLDALDVIVIDEEELQKQPEPQGKVVKLTTSDGDDLGPVTDDESSEHKDSAEMHADDVDDDLAFVGLFRPSESPVPAAALKPPQSENGAPELPASAIPAFVVTSPDSTMNAAAPKLNAAEDFEDIEEKRPKEEAAAFEEVITVVPAEASEAHEEGEEGGGMTFADLHRKSMEVADDEEASSGDDSAVVAALNKQKKGDDDSGSDDTDFDSDAEELHVYDEENLIFLYGDTVASEAAAARANRPAFPIPGATLYSDEESPAKPKKAKKKKARKEMPDIELPTAAPEQKAVKMAPAAPVITPAKKVAPPPPAAPVEGASPSSPPPPMIVVVPASPPRPTQQNEKPKQDTRPAEQPAAPKATATAVSAGPKGTDATTPMTFLSAYNYKSQPAPLPAATEEKKKGEDGDEDERQWTPIIAFNIRTTTFNVLIIAACLTGSWKYVNMLRAVGSTCDWFPYLASFTMAGYVFVAEPIFVLMVYLHRLLDSDEYDEFFSELHPYTGDVRDHGPLLMEV